MAERRVHARLKLLVQAKLEAKAKTDAIEKEKKRIKVVRKKYNKRYKKITLEDVKKILFQRNKNKMRNLLDKNFDCNMIIDGKYNLLMWMLKYWSNEDLIKKLLEKNVNVSYIAADEKNNTALILACKHTEDSEIVAKIIDKGDCLPEYANKKNMTALMTAISYSMLQNAALLLEKYKERSNPGFVNIENGNTALIEAITQYSHNDLLKNIILLNISNFGHANNDGQTALMHAIRYCDIFAVEELVKLKNLCNPWHVDKNGMTALDHICVHGQYLEIFLNNFSIDDAPVAIYKNQVKRLHNLLRRAIFSDTYTTNISELDIDSENINFPCRINNSKHVICKILRHKYLLQKFNDLSDIYSCILIKAIFSEYGRELFEMACKIGQEMNIKTEYVESIKMSPLIAACITKNDAYAMIIVQASLKNINCVDMHGKTACDYAHDNDMIEVVKKISSKIYPVIVSSLVPDNLLHKDLAYMVCDYIFGISVQHLDQQGPLFNLFTY